MTFAIHCVALLYFTNVNSLKINTDDESTPVFDKSSCLDAKQGAYVTMWYDPHIPMGLSKIMVNDSATDQQSDESLELSLDMSNPQGVLGIAAALRKVGSKRTLVFVTNSKDEKWKGKIEATYPCTEFVQMTRSINHKCNFKAKHKQWRTTFQKTYIFGLTQYEKLLWLDADVRILRNIDYLFENDLDNGKTFWAQRDTCKCHSNAPPCSSMCSGMMLFKPSEDLIQGVQGNLDQKIDCDGDQPIIAKYISDSNRTLKIFSEKTVHFGVCAKHQRQKPDAMHCTWNIC